MYIIPTLPYEYHLKTTTTWPYQFTHSSLCMIHLFWIIKKEEIIAI